MRANINGVEIGYDSFGPEAAPLALVLLHAFPLARGQWRTQAEALASDAGIRIVTPDLRGLGESAVPPGPATVEQMAEDVHGLLDALGIGACVLGGLSLGGYVALAAWRAYSRRIRGLILADTKAAADTPEGRAAREVTALLAEERGATAVIERDLPRLLSPLTINTRPDVVANVRALAGGNTGEGVAAVARGLALRPDATALLPAITCPALVLVGEQDAITPREEARVLFERIPDAALEVLPDAGHLSNLEQPGRFTERIARFLHERMASR